MNEPLFQHGICKQLAQKYNLPEETIKKIVYHQFKFVNNIMSQGDFESVRLKYFGRFHVNPGRLKKIQEKYDTKSK